VARQRVDPVFSALARRRPSLTSGHFGLSYEMLDALASRDVPDAPASREMPDAPASGRACERSPGRLGFSVPKRQLARAVDRNMLKRVAREAWRHARWGSIRRPCAAMLKLRRTDAQWKSTPRGALKKAWRAELDALFERLIARLRAEQRAGSGPAHGQAQGKTQGRTQGRAQEGANDPAQTEAAPVSPNSQPNRTNP
jgi:RNase P protein component